MVRSIRMLLAFTTLVSTCSCYKHQPLHLQHDHHHHQARRLKPRQTADAANGGCGKRRMEQTADASEYNRKTNGKRNSVTTTKGFNNTRQIAY